ncbi:class I SAM-dependent methyltransferase [Metabacillus arenae]|uniref:Class I SAM-dependent methyltransferase n=1 Tax=Metabacillus arenae TaxID=2771434 RepID=A0A926NQP0_9BACI|nr:class I SAM-dependent methyltransferase [Metabacillus arenae]MBD1382161.1 class I SAM-dependent methyltransferase [Metabacillus arenae]
MFHSYSELATEVYDLDKPLGHTFGDIEYYKKRLKSVSGHVLEPGTGSGRVLIPLLEAGFKVEGLDHSVHMLQSCRGRCEERGIKPTLYQMEMHHFKLPKKYEAIILPAGTFLLIEDRKESIQALKNFYDHLETGGKLILDLYLQNELSPNTVTTKSWNTKAGELITLETKMVEVDFLNQYSVSFLKYEKWKQGELMKSELQRLPQRWYGIKEFKLILERIGFSGITLSADYQYEKEPSHHDQTFTFEAIKG